MERPMEAYWQIRLKEVAIALEANNFAVHQAADLDRAKKIVMEEIFPGTSGANFTQTNGYGCMAW